MKAGDVVLIPLSQFAGRTQAQTGAAVVHAARSLIKRILFVESAPNSNISSQAGTN